MMITVLDGYAANPGDISWQEIEELGELTVLDRTNPDEIIEKAKDTEILLTNKCNIDTYECICYFGCIIHCG